MAKRNRYRRKKKITVPLLVVAPVAGQAVKYVQDAQAQGIERATTYLISNMTGYDKDSGSWQLSRAKNGLLPIVLGSVAHNIATRLGVNRALASAGVPFIRL